MVCRDGSTEAAGSAVSPSWHRDGAQVGWALQLPQLCLGTGLCLYGRGGGMSVLQSFLRLIPASFLLSVACCFLLSGAA